MSQYVSAAVIQLSPDEQIDANLNKAEDYIAQAAASGAQLIALQETFYYSGPHQPADMQRVSESLSGPVSQWLAQQARQHQIWLIGGSIFEANPDDPAKPFNTCQVFNPQGQSIAQYRKINLFHLQADQTYSEARYQTPGAARQSTTAHTPWGGLGLSICYDLRFPTHYQQQSRQHGATLLTVPSGFLARTGQIHWEPLLKARAIENQCFVLAPNAYGGSPRNHGHSMIIDPWGEILAQLPTGEGFVTAELDFKRLQEVRNTMPVLQSEYVQSARLS